VVNGSLVGEQLAPIQYAHVNEIAVGLPPEIYSRL
jgi:hypothetical protein